LPETSGPPATARRCRSSAPSTELPIGSIAAATRADLEEAVRFAETGFAKWRAMPAWDRGRILRRAAELIRERADGIADG
jgi:succinate-semialdehyde dehydrogenase/glutarate-semialdehyde dehydrogenase